MPLDTSSKGKTYPAQRYEVGKEKIREYAQAVGEDSPVYYDRDAAREAGFRDVPAPPMFAVVYSWPAITQTAIDPELGMDLARLLHGGQEFVWAEPVCAGDVVSTEASVKDIYPRGDNAFYVFETLSRNQDGQEVARGTWTNIVRGGAAE
ncbi:MAG: MaoC family dehydratase N-terminal domain-containing protein [Thermoleophilaceae bacterium]